MNLGAWLCNSAPRRRPHRAITAVRQARAVGILFGAVVVERWRQSQRLNIQALDAVLAAHPRSSWLAEPERSRVLRDLSVAERLADRLPLLPRTCLASALARYAVLCRRGVAPVFCLGIPARGDGPGHAWIEIDGAPWDEDPRNLQGIVATFRYPAGPAD
jgi:hypothetical protein